ncbi:hypothetical protein F4778DRAFT_8983 [Xylariomycetidae sp. FL2044]|nr:hypothetical protein F4778DRAFT_8983 [Xylariomycetidae sp. FL2044]
MQLMKDLMDGRIIMTRAKAATAAAAATASIISDITEDPITEDVGDVSMANADARLPTTPVKATMEAPFGSASTYTPPTTRSMSSAMGGLALTDKGDSISSFQLKLKAASTKTSQRASVSSLEDSRDIVRDLPGGRQHAEEDGRAKFKVEELGQSNVEVEAAEKIRGLKQGQSSNARVRQGQRRISVARLPLPGSSLMARRVLERDMITPGITPKTISKSRIRIKKSKECPLPTSTIRTLRRSSRLAKPLEVFHKYPNLPPEIKLLIWEAAITPRLAYIRNRSSSLTGPPSWEVQNTLPAWFMVDQMSLYVAKLHYRNMFAMCSPTKGLANITRAQPIAPERDIIIYEPCHSGCRSYFCAKHQYSEADRCSVKSLVMQIDSPNLVAGSEPGWCTISRSWCNVETLYFMKTAIRGPNSQDKAMIRAEEGNHETALRRGFDEWKKGNGKEMPLSKLEFVQIVDRENGVADPKDRYKSVQDRKTGDPEDIIIG